VACSALSVAKCQYSDILAIRKKYRVLDTLRYIDITNIWSLKSMKGYIDIVEPFVYLLALRRIYGRHTGEAIAADYVIIARKWKAPNKVLTEL
jgi:hypothetical protein